MEQDRRVKLPVRIWMLPLFLVLGLWFIYWIEIRFGFNFNFLGIYPRKRSGLVGIICSPFIHASALHLYSNSIPLAVLLSLMVYFYPERGYRDFAIGILGTGAITWLIGRESYHIGASGVIYFLAGYIFFKGLFSRHYRHMAISLLVVFLYGGMIWYVLPIEEGISWEGHLSGLCCGWILALLTPDKKQKPPQYSWEQEDFDPELDPFLRQFDASGNFVSESEILAQKQNLTQEPPPEPDHLNT